MPVVAPVQGTTDDGGKMADTADVLDDDDEVEEEDEAAVDVFSEVERSCLSG